MKKIKRVRGEKRIKRAKSAAADEMRIYISPIMLIMAVYFVAVGMAYEFVCSLAAVLLHECAHAKVAKKLGYELNVIKLMPYGAALCGENDRLRPKHEILIALAGPLFNLVLAVVFAALWWLVPTSYVFTEAFCMCNLYIGVFNMLPVYPLDGGRVALAALSAKLDRKHAYKIMRAVSLIAGIVAVGLFVLSAVYAPNICLLSVGLFMLASAFVPDKRAQYNALFSFGARRDRVKNPIEVRAFAVSESAELSALVRALDPDKFSEFTVVSDDGLRLMGTVGESELIDGAKSRGYDAKVREILSDTDKHKSV